MSDTPPSPPAAEPALPRPTVTPRRRRMPSMVWLVPVIALAIGVSLLIQNVLQKGPRVVIEFRSAEGISPGKTELRFKEVVVGRVDGVSLSADRQKVQVSVQLDRSVANIAVDDTRFWVVRPRIDTAGVSGLATLISGAYIGVDAGVSSDERSRFVGLEAPPFVLRGEPGRGFVLRAQDLGSLDVNSPLLYRRTRVGRVVGYTLDPVADEVAVQVFVEAPYDRLVNAQAKFWNASGVDLTLNAGGLTLNTQTLASLLAGGIAFERPLDARALPPAADGSKFKLFSDRKSALAPPDGQPVRVRMVFEQSIRGLAVGAPIDFLGMEIGTVQSIRFDFDGRRQRFPVEVEADVYPLRLGTLQEALPDATRSDVKLDRNFLKRLVANGLRAQMRTGNLLTGQLYVALDFIPRAAPAVLDESREPPAIPSVPGTLSELQPQLAEIVNKISKVPFDDIGRSVQDTLKQAQAAVARLTPEAQKSLAEVNKTLASVQASLARVDSGLLDANAPVQRNLEQTLVDLQRAAQSLRVLTDYLQRHPESLLRGKPGDAPLPPLPLLLSPSPATEPRR